MAHHPNTRNLGGPPDPQISKPMMDLTGKRHPRKSSTTSAAAAAVYDLPNYLSRLQPTKPQNPPPQKLVDTHMQVKALSKSVNFEPSSQKIGKQGKRAVFESDKKSLVVVGERREKEPAPASASAAAPKVKKVERELVKEEIESVAIIPRRKTMEKMGLGWKIDRRRSFCDAQVELANFLVTTCAKVVSVDMPPFMQIHAVGFSRKTKDSLEKFSTKSLALSLKKEFDGCYGPAWHCIVGTSFGSFVTHSVGGFLYFSLDQKVYVLLFKTAVQRAA